ncbi:PEPxxWA-CTERM sorting domain-containing protein [Duganella aceris]|uniref:PEP-CTERM sorting domain-containing protein n=1 Tax=Duganella aceris TaxID=2703883 RepID=A0ABX0FK12_9BURK|nr:PEPxxWA-CTERM sorting domain-containing protein [Duganella aceris]NGZ84906.1 PEP-CTERM sorting domain-containing protein [Duganella aceris]
MKRIIIAAVLSIAAISGAQAASIVGLNNTGLNSAGTAVGAGGAADGSYKLTAVTGNDGLSTGVPTITYDNQWPINPWLANSGTSKWITPTASQSQTLDAWSAGSYTYSLSFDLTGYNAASAAFTGRLAADNSVVIKLNNQTISNASGFTDWTSFSANSGFVSGVNTLDFVVSNWAQNGGNPTGLRVEFASSNVAAVPEPETYAMMLAGFALLGVVARRRKAA